MKISIDKMSNGDVFEHRGLLWGVIEVGYTTWILDMKTFKLHVPPKSMKTGKVVGILNTKRL